MAPKKKTTKKRTTTSNRSRNNSRSSSAKSEQEIIRDKEIIGIIIIAVSVLLLLNFILAPDQNAQDVGAFGVVSLFFMKVLRFLAGQGAITIPIFLLGFGILVCAGRNRRSTKGRLIGISLIFLGILGFIHLNQELLAFKEYINAACSGVGGGLLGALLDFILLKTIGRVGAIVILVAFLLIGLLLAFQTSLRQLFSSIGRGYKKTASILNFEDSKKDKPELVDPESAKRKRKAPVIITPEITDKEAKLVTDTPAENEFAHDFMPKISGIPLEEEEESAPQEDPTPAAQDNIVAFADLKEEHSVPLEAKEQTEPVIINANGEQVADTNSDSYILPPVDLIEAGIKVKNPRMNKMITDNIAVLENTLENFGVKATVTQVVAGPSVTRYELQPAPGVKVARITSLADDIALSLAAQSVRIEAPIPGKSAIGIEVARKDKDIVYFREMIESESFQKAESKLSVTLGKNIGGECVVADLTKMPHLLIAGTTGSGKSICINTIICSILYKAKPDEVKMMLIDPKKVELTTYSQLPHLIAPVINDGKKASNALKWVVNEMENRYTVFASAGVKDIDGYTRACPESPMCKIVVIIDELADLMMVAKHDVEESICRIAQLARAAGIHLVVATQRPSVDVITGLIKANIPSRIAFTVSSPVDSRTILDTGGAEKLLGKGDMLYDPVGNSKPMRIQGTFIDEKDVARLVDYCCAQAAPAFSENAVKAAVEGEKASAAKGEDLDDLFYEAGVLIINTGQASTSFLQRRLAIGNPRAARIMDMLESKGVVGGPNGSKPREVLLTLAEFEEMYGEG